MTTTYASLLDSVSEKLTTNVSEVFSTMLGLEARGAPPVDEAMGGVPLVASSVGFIGEATGVVYLRFAADFARTLASRMLGLTENEMADDMTNDAIGELSNMVVGSVKSQLCDAGFTCRLTIPSILRGKNLSVACVKPSVRRMLGFVSGENPLLIELLMKVPDAEA